MPLSAQSLFTGAQLDPAAFGIDHELGDDEQLAAAIAYLEEPDDSGSSILTSSNSEVAVPVRTVLGTYLGPLDNEGLKALFGAQVGSDVIALWNAAQMSFGRSELNKRVDSNSKTYDEDSDQDRIQGNQKLKKLIEFIVGWKAIQDNAGQEVEQDLADLYPSCSVPVVSTW